MRLGRGFTAVARQVPRLAGLVRLPANCIVKTAIRRQASWLAIKASVKSNPRWPFVLQTCSSHALASQATRAEYAPRQRRLGRATSGVAVPLAFFCILFFEHTPLGKGKRRQARIQNSCGFRRGGSRRLHPQITGKDETITVYWLKGKTVCLQAHVFPFFVSQPKNEGTHSIQKTAVLRKHKAEDYHIKNNWRKEGNVWHQPL